MSTDDDYQTPEGKIEEHTLPAFPLKAGCWCSSFRALKTAFVRLFD